MEKNQVTRRQMLILSGGALLADFAAAGFSAAQQKRAASYEDAVLVKKPVGYWRLGDEGLQKAKDASSNGHDGTYHGDPKRTRGALRADANAAVALDGKSYVEIPDSADFSQPTSGSGLTVEAWIRPDALAFEGETSDPYVHWLGKGKAGQQEWALRFYSKETKRSNRISAYLWSPTGGLGAGAYFQDALKPGEWIHVVACYDRGDWDTKGKPGVHIYKNGVHRLGPPSTGTLYNSAKWQVKPAHGNTPLYLGTRDRKSFLIGGLDEVAIYPRVLKAKEILENYNAGKGA